MILYNHTPCLHYCTTAWLLRAGLLRSNLYYAPSYKRTFPPTTVVTYTYFDIHGTLLVSRYFVVETFFRSRYLS